MSSTIQRDALTYAEAAELLDISTQQVVSAVLRHDLEMTTNEESITCITRVSIEAYQQRLQKPQEAKPRTRKAKARRTITLPAQVKLAIVHLDLLAELGLSSEQCMAFFSGVENKRIVRGGMSYSMTQVHLERGKGAYTLVATIDKVDDAKEGNDASK